MSFGWKSGRDTFSGHDIRGISWLPDGKGKQKTRVEKRRGTRKGAYTWKKAPTSEAAALLLPSLLTCRVHCYSVSFGSSRVSPATEHSLAPRLLLPTRLVQSGIRVLRRCMAKVPPSMSFLLNLTDDFSKGWFRARGTHTLLQCEHFLQACTVILWYRRCPGYSSKRGSCNWVLNFFSPGIGIFMSKERLVRLW